MDSLTYKQKILIHLYTYRNVDTNDPFNLPWELTQDGIASALCISRAHASIELKKLNELNYITENQAHVKNGKVRRRVYSLNQAGTEAAEEIKSYAEKNNIDLNVFIDKKQDMNSVIENLDEQSKDALGYACVFRVPVPRELIPKTPKNIVPVSVTGTTAITDGVRKQVLGSSDPKDVEKWHSFAADIWLDHWNEMGDNIDMIQERLYHLVNAGRMIESCKLVSKYQYEILNTPNKDTLSNIQKIAYSEKYAEDVLITRLELDGIMRDLRDMRDAAEQMRKYDEWTANMFAAVLEYMNGNREKATEMLNKLNTEDPMVNVFHASILFENGEIQKAKEMLLSTKDLNSSKCPNLPIAKFVILARISKAEGNDADAYKYLMKARASVPDSGKKWVDDLVNHLDLKKFCSS